MLKHYIIVLLTMLSFSCQDTATKERQVTAADILGNPDYKAICYSGYRKQDRSIEPSKAELKEDLLLLHAMGFKLLRTYNVYLPQVKTMLQAIKELKVENPNFEMYVMLGAWINCKNAYTGIIPDHTKESPENADEIKRAVALANDYVEIVKIIAVGNEAMVHWAQDYYVQPSVILKWVTHLQNLKISGDLSKSIWITSSDDYSSWGGGDAVYHTPNLEALIRAVDYISMHTYPMHNTHYNPDFWYLLEENTVATKKEQIDAAMQRSLEFAIAQYDSVNSYMKSIGVKKPIHIGETGWATQSNGFYSKKGSRACDEYKSARYYELITNWAKENNISCFYFEAFDEPWKDADNPNGSENHFGLFTVDGKAKYAIWDEVDKGIFEGLGRDRNQVTKTFNGNKEIMMQNVFVPPIASKKQQ